MRNFAIVLLGVFSLAACADQQNSLKQLTRSQALQQSWVLEQDLVTAGKLTVVDEANQPIPNATVLIGQKAGDPFAGNTLVTDASGKVDLPSGFKAPLPVTVQAPNYVTLTYAKLSPTAQQIQMHKADGQSKIEVKGDTTNFSGLVDDDGKIDFGLVIPSLNRASMLSFDMSTVLSPENDQITIAGHTTDIPSNITLPQQSETYIIVPVDLNKPTFRTYVRNPGTYHMNGIHGWFPMQQVVSDIRAGKPFFDVINYFNFTSAGSMDVDVQTNIAGQNLNVNQVPMDNTIPLTAPNYDKANQMISIALANTNGTYMPTDLKRLLPGQTIQLKATSKVASRAVLSVLVNPAPPVAEASNIVTADDLLSIDRHLSAIFTAASKAGMQNMNQLSIVYQNAGSPSPNFLPLIAKPTVGSGVVSFTAPALPAGLQAVGTYLVYSDILPSGTGTVKSETRTRLWELWTEGWVNSMQLPELTFNKIAGHTYRWELLFLATDSATALNGGIESLDINSVTHVTRNTVDAQ